MLRLPHLCPSRFLAAGLLAALAVGCGSTPPSDFYTVTGFIDAERTTETEAPFKVGLQPVVLPTVVERPQMVFSLSSSQLQVDEYARWAGPLDELVSSAIEWNLEKRLGKTAVYRQPARISPQFQYLLAIEITRFESVLDGPCSLSARFDITDRTGKWLYSESVESSFDSSQELFGGGPSGVAGAMSFNLGSLCDAIAAALTRQHEAASASE